MNYKQLTDEAIERLKFARGLTLYAERLEEQARRANRLAEAVDRWFLVSRMDEDWSAVLSALRGYRGEGARVAGSDAATEEEA